MQGRIIKLISNDYTVLSDDKAYVCKSRGLFRNKNIKPLVGDLVIFDEENNYILEVLPRKTELVRPPIANIDQAVIITSVKNPDLDATLIAKQMAEQLEARASFRTVQKKAIQKVRKAGAKGCKTLISGRLAGADIARSEGYHEGIIPLHTLRSDIDYALAEAHTTYGRLGCKVWICRGEILPTRKEKKGE